MADLLRLVTCGSVDDGKSTLIGRLLHDFGALSEDQLQDLAAGSGETPDFSLALDGLAAEREQGITIDVAYRSFSTLRRRLLIADVPGHEQYTRNMITGASNADTALLVIDVRNGVLSQTRRHTFLAWLLGIRHFILAVNKMDLVGFSQAAFNRVTAEYKGLLSQLGAVECCCIPVSARFGDNVVASSPHTPWFQGPSVAEALNEVQIENPREAAPFRFPVQWINRALAGLRGYSGMIAAGEVRVGDLVKIQPSHQQARIIRIATPDDDNVERAVAGRSVTLVLDRQLDIGRGHLICALDSAAECADCLEATTIWMDQSPLLRGRSYRLKIGTATVLAHVSEVQHRIDIDTFARAPAGTLKANEIGKCTFELDEPLAFDRYEHSRDTGGFILIDRITNDTVGAGLVSSGTLKAQDVPWQKIEVTRSSRSLLKKHAPAILWFTGISGAGKSTIANLVEKRLHAEGRHTYLLDGDNIRHGLNRDLGFSDVDRVENVRRVAEVAKLMADAGLVVLVALISPFRAERAAAREMVSEREFIEIFVDTPLEVAEARDVKGLYRKARLGQISAFTGIDSSYQVPEHPELHIETTAMSALEAAEEIVAYLDRNLFAA
jgi:bifunctional enzyme CysN/CysC